MDIYRFKKLGFRLPQGSGLIKASEAAKLSAANDLVASAEAQAAQIVEEAKQHLEAERERGFAEGQKAAEQAALERLLTEHATLDAHLSEIEESLARLVLVSVRKIVHGFDDISLAEALIQSGLTKVRREKRVQIRVPEALADTLRERIDALMAAFPAIEFMDVVEDPALRAPNIIIETAVGRIDCDLDAKLTHLDDALTEVAANRAADPALATGGVHD
ncbi:type III secretion system stator protein SctL [Yoonia sp. BS5-3]|uniref:Type 3 secretion system stator protein n=1 Tax=Yoonia phaeophyticola TaxID=3137369 RepID=A0ABZ2V996_9RHOB